MDTSLTQYLWYAVGALLLLIILLSFIIWWRNKKDAVMKLLNGSGQEKGAKPLKDQDWKEWLEGHRRAAASLLIVVAGVTLWYLIPANIRPSDLGNIGKAHWLQILLLWGVGATLVALNAAEKLAPVLQKTLGAVAIMLLIGFPWWAWVSSPSSTTQVTTSSEEPWNLLIVPAYGKSEDILLDPGTTFKIQVRDDTHILRVHCVYRGGHEIEYGKNEAACPGGDMVSVYMTNSKPRQNRVLWQKVKI